MYPTAERIVFSQEQAFKNPQWIRFGSVYSALQPCCYFPLTVWRYLRTDRQLLIFWTTSMCRFSDAKMNDKEDWSLLLSYTAAWMCWKWKDKHLLGQKMASILWWTCGPLNFNLFGYVCCSCCVCQAFLHVWEWRKWTRSQQRADALVLQQRWEKKIKQVVHKPQFQITSLQR